MFCFFDVETTGVPRDYRAPVENLENWPRMVQLAYLIADEEGEPCAQSVRIIKPEGYTIPDSVAAIHGITTKRAMEEGVPLAEALVEYTAALLHSALIPREPELLIAHNIDFDWKIVGAEFLRKGIKALKFFELPRLCTMKAATTYCALPGPYGFKWPKLEELYHKLFDEPMRDAHDAGSDVMACAKCFFELRRRGIINLEAAAAGEVKADG